MTTNYTSSESTRQAALWIAAICGVLAVADLLVPGPHHAVDFLFGAAAMLVCAESYRKGARR